MHRAHAFRDLQAYVCTAGGTECDEKLFGSRNSWFEHELLHHRSQFHCSLCGKRDFVSREKLSLHIGSEHEIKTADHFSSIIDAGITIPSLFKATDCPFCDDVSVK